MMPKRNKNATNIEKMQEIKDLYDTGLILGLKQ